MTQDLSYSRDLKTGYTRYAAPACRFRMSTEDENAFLIKECGPAIKPHLTKLRALAASYSECTYQQTLSTGNRNVHGTESDEEMCVQGHTFSDCFDLGEYFKTETEKEGLEKLEQLGDTPFEQKLLGKKILVVDKKLDFYTCYLKPEGCLIAVLNINNPSNFNMTFQVRGNPPHKFSIIDKIGVIKPKTIAKILITTNPKEFLDFSDLEHSSFKVIAFPLFFRTQLIDQRVSAFWNTNGKHNRLSSFQGEVHNVWRILPGSRSVVKQFPFFQRWNYLLHGFYSHPSKQTSSAGKKNGAKTTNKTTNANTTTMGTPLTETSTNAASLVGTMLEEHEIDRFLDFDLQFFPLENSQQKLIVQKFKMYQFKRIGKLQGKLKAEYAAKLKSAAVKKQQNNYYNSSLRSYLESAHVYQLRLENFLSSYAIFRIPGFVMNRLSAKKTAVENYFTRNPTCLGLIKLFFFITALALFWALLYHFFGSMYKK